MQNNYINGFQRQMQERKQKKKNEELQNFKNFILNEQFTETKEVIEKHREHGITRNNKYGLIVKQDSDITGMISGDDEINILFGADGSGNIAITQFITDIKKALEVLPDGTFIYLKQDRRIFIINDTLYITTIEQNSQKTQKMSEFLTQGIFRPNGMAKNVLDKVKQRIEGVKNLGMTRDQIFNYHQRILNRQEYRQQNQPGGPLLHLQPEKAKPKKLKFQLQLQLIEQMQERINQIQGGGVLSETQNRQLSLLQAQLKHNASLEEISPQHEETIQRMVESLEQTLEQQPQQPQQPQGQNKALQQLKILVQELKRLGGLQDSQLQQALQQQLQLQMMALQPEDLQQTEEQKAQLEDLKQQLLQDQQLQQALQEMEQIQVQQQNPQQQQQNQQNQQQQLQYLVSIPEGEQLTSQEMEKLLEYPLTEGDLRYLEPLLQQELPHEQQQLLRYLEQEDLQRAAEALQQQQEALEQRLQDLQAQQEAPAGDQGALEQLLQDLERAAEALQAQLQALQQQQPQDAEALQNLQNLCQILKKPLTEGQWEALQNLQNPQILENLPDELQPIKIQLQLLQELKRLEEIENRQPVENQQPITIQILQSLQKQLLQLNPRQQLSQVQLSSLREQLQALQGIRNAKHYLPLQQLQAQLQSLQAQLQPLAPPLQQLLQLKLQDPQNLESLQVKLRKKDRKLQALQQQLQAHLQNLPRNQQQQLQALPLNRQPQLQAHMQKLQSLQVQLQAHLQNLPRNQQVQLEEETQLLQTLRITLQALEQQQQNPEQQLQVQLEASLQALQAELQDSQPNYPWSINFGKLQKLQEELQQQLLPEYKLKLQELKRLQQQQIQNQKLEQCMPSLVKLLNQKYALRKLMEKMKALKVNTDLQLQDLQAQLQPLTPEQLEEQQRLQKLQLLLDQKLTQAFQPQEMDKKMQKLQKILNAEESLNTVEKLNDFNKESVDLIYNAIDNTTYQNSGEQLENALQRITWESRALALAKEVSNECKNTFYVPTDKGAVYFEKGDFRFIKSFKADGSRLEADTNTLFLGVNSDYDSFFKNLISKMNKLKKFNMTDRQFNEYNEKVIQRQFEQQQTEALEDLKKQQDKKMNQALEYLKQQNEQQDDDDRQRNEQQDDDERQQNQPPPDDIKYILRDDDGKVPLRSGASLYENTSIYGTKSSNITYDATAIRVRKALIPNRQDASNVIPDLISQALQEAIIKSENLFPSSLSFTNTGQKKELIKDIIYIAIENGGIGTRKEQFLYRIMNTYPSITEQQAIDLYKYASKLSANYQNCAQQRGLGTGRTEDQGLNPNLGIEIGPRFSRINKDHVNTIVGRALYMLMNGQRR